MTTVSDIETRIMDFFPIPSPGISRSVREFSRRNVNSSGKELDVNILQFVSRQLLVTLPPGWKLRAYEEMSALLRVNKPRGKSNGVPDFILANVLAMPGNRGYMWQGKKYYGKLPAASHEIVLFEPRRGRTLIHVWSGSFYKVFERMKGMREQRLVKVKKLPQKVPERVEQTEDVVKPPEKSRVLPTGSFAVLYESDSDDTAEPGE